MTQHKHTPIDEWIEEGLTQLPRVEQREDLVEATMDQVFEVARQKRGTRKRSWLTPVLTLVATIVVGWGTQQYGLMQDSNMSHLFLGPGVMLVLILWYWQLDRVASRQLSKWLARKQRP